MEKALGRVLIVDEAYRLASEGLFAQEAIDELVGILTQEQFLSKVVVILAGYDQDMNRLMAMNSGLSSRFPDVVVFPNMSPTSCLHLLDRELKKNAICLPELGDTSSGVYTKMKLLVEELSLLPSWGNARDMKTISKAMINLVLQAAAADQSNGALMLSGPDAISCMELMLAERLERTTNVPAKAAHMPVQNLEPPPETPRSAPPSHIIQKRHITKEPEIQENKASIQGADSRDAGVTDAVWNQLQSDIQAASVAAKVAEGALRLEQENLRKAHEREEAQQILVQRLEQVRAKDAAEKEEQKRQLEEARLQECLARAERDRIAALLEAKQKEEARQRQQEAKAQAALRQMGVCVAGFQWIKQHGGYRCAGGSHFVTDQQLGM